MLGLAVKSNFMPSTHCPVVPVQLVFFTAVMDWPDFQSVMTYGPVPSGLRLICLPTWSHHFLDMTEVNGMVMAMRNAPSGFSRVICTVYGSTTL